MPGFKINPGSCFTAFGGIAAFFLALNPVSFPENIVFILAALVVVIVSMARGPVNGIFAALIFNFGYFSLHPGADITAFILNTAVFSALAVISDRISLPGAGKQAGPADGNEKVFTNKIINSFMIAHESLWEIEKGTGKKEAFTLFAKNIINLLSIKQAAVYTAEGSFRLILSYGKYTGRLTEELNPEEFSGQMCGNIPADKKVFIKGVSAGNFLLVPVKEDGKIKEIAALYKEEEFDYSDIYIAEFFVSQFYVITEKQKLISKLKENYNGMARALALAIDTKDRRTHGHSVETMEYAEKLSEKAGLSGGEKRKIKYASLLHDIGKVNISGEILNKPASLTEEEYEKVKKHPEEGVKILENLSVFSDITNIILHHHEHINGKGYPGGLKGEEIPLGSRICAIADAYSVMRSARPYKKEMSKYEAIEELKRCSGSQFDKRLVDTFLDIINNACEDGEGEERMIN